MNKSILSFELNQSCLYKEENEKSSIPQIPIFNILTKFDGITTQDNPNWRKTMRIKKLPKYLILHMKRFQKNNFFTEKNSVIVRFPLNSLDLNPCNLIF